jgi:hypothetical protein
LRQAEDISFQVADLLVVAVEIEDSYDADAEAVGSEASPSQIQVAEQETDVQSEQKREDDGQVDQSHPAKLASAQVCKLLEVGNEAKGNGNDGIAKRQPDVDPSLLPGVKVPLV